MEVIELSRVGPPPGSVGESYLHLTFFDVPWIHFPPVQRIFFFEFADPSSTDITRFLKSVLPNLKHSLSLALRLFYPLSGTLTLSHEIRYVDGDSVTLIVAESDSDFHTLVADHPKQASLFHPLLPELPTSDLLALQITVFPHSGIGIGVSVHHVAADGSSSIHFMKHWASISRLGGDESNSMTPPPLYDRSLIPDPDGLKRIYLDQMQSYKQEQTMELLGVQAQVDLVRATFVLSRAHIERLRQRIVKARPHVDGDKPLHCSSFVLTFAYVWICLCKARVAGDEGDKTFHFGFAVECRTRLCPPIPTTYFGNCIGMCMGDAKGSALVREDGFFVACEAIGREIQGLKDGVLKGAEGWTSRFKSIAGLIKEGRVHSVAGSPRLRVYDTDFGFGKPCKVEVISIEEAGAMSLAESRDGSGGLEIGLVLPKSVMDGFASLFQDGLKDHVDETLGC